VPSAAGLRLPCAFFWLGLRLRLPLLFWLGLVVLLELGLSGLLGLGLPALTELGLLALPGLRLLGQLGLFALLGQQRLALLQPSALSFALDWPLLRVKAWQGRRNQQVRQWTSQEEAELKCW
jgi:hypothetical protein